MVAILLGAGLWESQLQNDRGLSQYMRMNFSSLYSASLAGRKLLAIVDSLRILLVESYYRLIDKLYIAKNGSKAL